MTPLPPPPRDVRATHARPILNGILYVVLLAALAGTLFFLGVIANELALRWLGHEVAATVSRIHEEPNASGTYDRLAEYTYALPGRPAREDRSELSWAPFREMSMPYLDRTGGYDDIIFPADARPAMPVRAYAIGPIAYSRAVQHDWGKFYLPVAAMFVAVCGLLSLSLYVAGVARPRRHRRLYTHGVAVPGTVTGRDQRHSKNGSLYVVHYAFTPGGNGGATPLAATAIVPDQAAYDAATPGRAVTVLHDPADPRRSTVYEYCGFRCA